MAALFRVHGPFEVPCEGRQSYWIKTGCPEFWQHSETAPLAKERGCYLFAVRAGRGFRPVYVGKTVKGFEQECFTQQKIADHYSAALDAKGTPVMFLVALDRATGLSTFMPSQNWSRS